MPKIGPFKIPNHDIETVVELIDEAYNRVNVQPGTLEEETFQDDVLQRHGGSYNRYRFSLQQYGFLERQHGADEVKITERFVDVADPVPREARQEAIGDAVRGVPILVEMYEAGFEPGFSDRKLRVWLIQEQNVPRDKADDEAIKDLRNLYEPAFPYFEEDDEGGGAAEHVSVDEDASLSPDGPPAGEHGGGVSGEYEEFQIGDRYVRLPNDNLAEEWDLLKSTVDAYVKHRTNQDGDEGDGDEDLSSFGAN